LHSFVPSQPSLTKCSRIGSDEEKLMREGNSFKAGCLWLAKAFITAAVAKKLEFGEVLSEIQGKVDRFLTSQNVVTKRTVEDFVVSTKNRLDRGYPDTDFWPHQSNQYAYAYGANMDV
jgi:hypothetical protein